MKFATINQLSLHYKLSALADRPTLVFINSLGSDLRSWAQVLPHFADRFQLLGYDKRGHGLSDCPPAPYTIRDHANDLLGLLDHLQVKTATVIGISVGGLIAQEIAIEHPERVERLVLCDTAAKIGTPDMWNKRINTLRAHGMTHLGEAILQRWFAPSFGQQDPAAYRGYYNMLTRTPVEGYTGTCEAIRDVDLRATVGTIRAKTLVLCGSEDSATPPELGQELAEQIPNARFAPIPQAGHLPCIEQPHAMATLIDQFLQELS